MTENSNHWDVLRKFSWEDLWLIVGVLVVTQLIVVILQWVIRGLAEKVPSPLRLPLLRVLPIARLLIRISAIVIIVPLLVDPTFQNVITLLASVGLALAFALKDFVSSAIGGLMTVLENTYQPGDWIEIDGTYGEVKSIGVRSVRIVTPEDTEVIIPHSKLWSKSIFNASSGNHSLLCIADFYLHPDHDMTAVRKSLNESARGSPYWKPESSVVVVAKEKPWGTHYRLKAYVKESREQFLFVTDLTERGKVAIRPLGVRFAQAPYAEIKH